MIQKYFQVPFDQFKSHDFENISNSFIIAGLALSFCKETTLQETVWSTHSIQLMQITNMMHKSFVNTA